MLGNWDRRELGLLKKTFCPGADVPPLPEETIKSRK